MDVLRSYRQPVGNPNDPDAVSARRIRVFFDLDDSSLTSGEELSGVQARLRSLDEVASGIGLELPEDTRRVLRPLVDWLCGAQTKQVAETIGIEDIRFGFDTVRKSAMGLLGTEAVYQALVTQPGSIVE